MKIYSFVPAGIWLMITCILLVLPGSDIPQASFLDLIYFDKWVHIGMFSILTFLWCLPFLKTEKASVKLFIEIAACTVIYGVLMEYAQKYLAVDRDFDPLDIIADCVGSMLSLFWITYFLRRKQV